MTIPLRVATALGLEVCGAMCIAVAAAQPVQPRPTIPEIMPKVEPPKDRRLDLPDIVFYVAKGDANACGHGCDTWIAADGRIDFGAAERLRGLLAKLGNRRLPVFHSPGGDVNSSLALGRLIRSQGLVAGVARTTPHGCDRKDLRGTACEDLKRSGAELMAEFDTDGTMCSSACVYALGGGTARLVPPWGKLGIHSFGSTVASATRVIPPWGPPAFQSIPPIAKPRAIPSAALEARAELVNSRIEDFLREMGIDPALRAEAAKTPFESLRLLDRDELVRFRIDTRDFGETGWRFAEKPKPVMFKSFFARTDGEQIIHRNATLRMSCGAGQLIDVALVRELAPLEPTRPAPLTVRGEDWTFDLTTTTSGYSASPPFRFETTATVQPAGRVDLLRSAGDAGMIEIVPKFPGSSNRWPQGITLTMVGFSTAYAKLRKSCDEPVGAQ
jgi:hypothetical protein